MIVRISAEGQYRLDDALRQEVNDLDNRAVEAVEAGDEGRFRELLEQMEGMVRDRGEALADDELVESDVILPPADISLEEARADFSGEGLIPD